MAPATTHESVLRGVVGPAAATPKPHLPAWPCVRSAGMPDVALHLQRVGAVLAARASARCTRCIGSADESQASAQAITEEEEARGAEEGQDAEEAEEAASLSSMTEPVRRSALPLSLRA